MADQTEDLTAGLEALEERAAYVAARLGLIANPKRLLILCRLVEGEASVSQIQAVVGLSQSALSQHLGRLREAGMLTTRREAQTIYYRLADPETRALIGALYEIFCADLEPDGAPPARAGSDPV